MKKLVDLNPGDHFCFYGDLDVFIVVSVDDEKTVIASYVGEFAISYYIRSCISVIS